MRPSLDVPRELLKISANELLICTFMDVAKCTAIREHLTLTFESQERPRTRFFLAQDLKMTVGVPNTVVALPRGSVMKFEK